MNFTPQQLAEADQRIAGITHQLDRLTVQAEDPVVALDELAVVLLEEMNADTLAVVLAVAVKKLAGRR